MVSNGKHMYNIHLLLSIIIVGAALWAVITKNRQNNKIGAFDVAVCAIALLINYIVVVHLLDRGSIPLWASILQTVASCMILPFSYFYFARQLGFKGALGTNIAMLAVNLLLLLPNLSVELYAAETSVPAIHDPIVPWNLNIFIRGTHVYHIALGSVILLLQAILTIISVPFSLSEMHKYDLRFSPKVKFFLLWWLAALGFIGYLSLIPLEVLKQPFYTWLYVGGYVTIVPIVFVLMANGFDHNPVITPEDENMDIESYIKGSQALAEKARRMFQEDRLYLQPGLVIDDIVASLGTNRTYFTRMMRSEFGMSFTEYITNERINYAKRRLEETDLPLEEIANECAFGNASAFCRVFKRYTEMTPDSWRRQHKEGVPQ